jgi:exopolysaccharide production protein ExoY
MTAHYPEFLESQQAQKSLQNSVARPVGRPGVYRGALKRGLDVGLIVIALPVVLPLILVLALLVLLDGHSPFYTQPRIGMNGRIFRFWKLRTMVHNAEARLTEHLAGDAGARAEWDHAQKLKCDPRITRIGLFLRKTSLDELPQLWNVLKGDMSLVGPRPMMPEQKVLYPGTAYYSLRPGITGSWQVTDRNESSFAARAEFDTSYEETLSLGNDLRILAATVAVVLRGTGY